MARVCRSTSPAGQCPGYRSGVMHTENVSIGSCCNATWENEQMARGGYRPGGGRPKSAANFVKHPSVPAQKSAAVRRRTPLRYMLDTMNDHAASPERRDRMAIAAAPFCHPKIADNRIGKKAAEAADAKAAATGRYKTPAGPGEKDTNWSDDLTANSADAN